MQLPDSLRLNRRTAGGIQIAALCVFVLAFFLPACRFHDNGPKIGSDTFLGWECARIALQWTITSDGYKGWGFLAVMSGWLNPFMLLLLILSLSGKLPRLRRILATAILVCLFATWGFFLAADLIPLIGHFLWAIGALAILTAEHLSNQHPDTNEIGHKSSDLLQS